MAHSINTRKTAVGATIIAVLFAAACADSATRSGPVGPSVGGPSFGIISQVGDRTPEGELFEVCKTYVGGTGPAVTINIAEDVTANGVGVDNTGSATLADGECEEIVVSAGSTVTVTEVVPAGYTSSWVKTQILGGVLQTPTSGSTNTTSGPVGGSPIEGTLVEFTNTLIPVETGDQGCTPGYWKQDQHFDSWTTYTTDQLAGSVFSLGGFSTLASKTLLQTLNGGGGSGVTGAATILLRAAVAALLNSESTDVDYPRTTADIIADVNAALATNNRDTILALAAALDADNNLGCPLN